MPQIPDRLTTLYPPCFYCKHLTNAGTQEPDLRGWTCRAFERGIPYDILTRQSSHTEPDMGQDGSYVFESTPEYLEDAEPPGDYQVTFDGEWKPVS